jgi:prolipoprotein diacylglyceryl transferase
MIFHWNPDPVAFSIDFLHLHIHWYGICFATGFFLAYLISRILCKIKGYPVDKLDTLLLVMFTGTVVGARICHVVFYQPQYFWEHPLEILYIWQGGLASHGGVVGAAIAFTWFCIRNREFSPMWMLDHMSIAFGVGAACIRLGNFMNSEIVGIPTDGTYGIVFDRLGTQPLHPVMLYESFCYFMCSFTALVLYKLKFGNRPGFMFGTYIAMAFTSRMILEVVKSGQAEYEIEMNEYLSQYVSLPFFVSVGMLLSIPFILVGIGFMIYGITHYDPDSEKPLSCTDAAAPAPAPVQK